MKSFLLLTICLIPGAAWADSFESFDAKGTTYTCGTAIASDGLVAGIASDLVVGSDSRAASNAGLPFLYAAGRFTVPHLPLPAGTVEFTGVNRFRSITGIDFSPSITAPGSVNFIAHHGALAYPTSVDGYAISEVGGITDRGAMLGTITIPAASQFALPRTIGYLTSPAGTTTLIDDGSDLVLPRGTDARADRIVGYSFGATTSGWIWAGGVFTPVNVPGASFTIPAGVDESGRISGSYIVGAGTQTETTHGFFLHHGRYVTYDVPGATSTVIQGMNEADQVTGCFTDSTGTHGFIRTP